MRAVRGAGPHEVGEFENGVFDYVFLSGAYLFFNFAQYVGSKETDQNAVLGLCLLVYVTGKPQGELNFSMQQWLQRSIGLSHLTRKRKEKKRAAMAKLKRL